MSILRSTNTGKQATLTMEYLTKELKWKSSSIGTQRGKPVGTIGPELRFDRREFLNFFDGKFTYSLEDSEKKLRTFQVETLKDLDYVLALWNTKKKKDYEDRFWEMYFALKEMGDTRTSEQLSFPVSF